MDATYGSQAAGTAGKTRAKPQTSRLRRDGVHDVRLHRGNAGGANIVQICRANPLAIACIELLERAAITRAEDSRPPRLRRRHRVFAGFGNNLRLLDTSVAEQSAKRRRIADAIPGIEPFVKIRPDLSNGIPEGRGRRFKEMRAPGRDGELPTGTHDIPEGAHGSRHVGDEENAEHADHGIEARSRQPEIQHVAAAEFDIAQPSTDRLRPRQLEHVLREIDAENRALGPDLLRGYERGGSAPATDVEHVSPGLQAE